MRGYNKTITYMLFFAGPLTPSLSPVAVRHPHLHIFPLSGGGFTWGEGKRADFHRQWVTLRYEEVLTKGSFVDNGCDGIYHVR